MSKRLPEKRRRFIEAYLGEARGNATEAARIAGYGSPAVEGCRLLKNAQVQEELEKRVSEDPAVKSREEILRWWSKMMDAGGVEPRDRIKASELLAKAYGMFVQKVEHSGPGGSPIEVSAEQSDGVRRLLSDETARERLIDALGVLSAGAGSGTA